MLSCYQIIISFSSLFSLGLSRSHDFFPCYLCLVFRGEALPRRQKERASLYPVWSSWPRCSAWTLVFHTEAAASAGSICQRCLPLSACWSALPAALKAAGAARRILLVVCVSPGTAERMCARSIDAWLWHTVKSSEACYRQQGVRVVRPCILGEQVSCVVGATKGRM